MQILHILVNGVTKGFQTILDQVLDKTGLEVFVRDHSRWKRGKPRGGVARWAC
jgi:hypothetical protein